MKFTHEEKINRHFSSIGILTLMHQAQYQYIKNEKYSFKFRAASCFSQISFLLTLF